MSNHKTPLTELERTGLIVHGLKDSIGKPSQLADVFRQGVAWALMGDSQREMAIAKYQELDAMLRARATGRGVR
jgi:hypothetical protein